MIARIRQLFNTYILSKDMPLEGRLFNMTLMLCLCGSIFGLVTTALQASSVISVLSTALLVTLLFALLILCNWKRLYRLGGLIVVGTTCFLVFPFIFFSGGGLHSGMPAYFILGVVMIAVLLDGPRYLAALILYVVTCVVCYTLGYFYPDLVTPIASDFLIYADISTSFIGAGVLISLVLKYQERETLSAKREAEDGLQRAREASRAKSDFLSNMSQEIRTPMNAIIGMTTIGQRSTEFEVKDRCLGQIHDASNHLLGIINDILDMSKIEANKLTLSEVAFDLRGTIDMVTSVINFRAAEVNQSIEIVTDERLPAILIGDDQRLAQVITNLLSNAIKFSPEGSVIGLNTQLLDETDGFCTIQTDVSDHGIGISEEQMSRLFKSFEQAESGISRNYGGTGLGLAISKRIVEAMGGRIWVTSKLNEGSTFSFTVKLRVSQEDADETQDATVARQTRSNEPPRSAVESTIRINAEVADGATRETTVDTSEQPAGDTPTAKSSFEEGVDFSAYHILLVEDVEVNRTIVEALLEPTEVNIDEARNGREALELFTANPARYDLILMDVQMPEMDGYTATRGIRALDVPAARTVPIIAMTANVFREDVEKALDAGMDAHIGKPIDLDELLKLMESFFRPKP
jgi:signal transduction histidine kinase/CheY-like chemotaxis protein